jgi:hypothetical protein
MSSIRNFIDFCTKDDFVERNMEETTKKKRDHIGKIDRLIQELRDEKSNFENKLCELKQHIVTLNKKRLSEIKKDNEERSRNLVSNEHRAQKYQEIFNQYLKLKDNMVKFMDDNIKKFNRKYITILVDRTSNSLPNLHNGFEIDPHSDEEENLFINPLDRNSQNNLINVLKQKFPHHSEEFLKYAISDSHISKEVFIKKENLRGYENKNNIMFKITLDSFAIEEKQKKLNLNHTIQNNNINNIQSNTDFVSNIFNEFCNKLKYFFKFYAIKQNNSAYILKIGGKLNDGLKVSECYNTLNEIIFMNKYTLQGSLYIYRMIEQIFIDMNYTLPDNLSEDELSRINFNISDLYDVRDYFKSISFS